MWDKSAKTLRCDHFNYTGRRRADIRAERCGASISALTAALARTAARAQGWGFKLGDRCRSHRLGRSLR